MPNRQSILSFEEGGPRLLVYQTQLDVLTHDSGSLPLGVL